MRVAAASRGMLASPMPAGHGLALLADNPDRQRRDGGPELVIRRKHPVVAMPVLPRRRDEIGEPLQKLKRREFDDAIGSRPNQVIRNPIAVIAQTRFTMRIAPSRPMSMSDSGNGGTPATSP